MGAKLPACQNAIMALIFPINHVKKSVGWCLPSEASSPFLNHPRVHGAHSVPWAGSCCEAPCGKGAGGADRSAHGAPALRGSAVGPRPGWPCTSSPVAAGMRWPGSPEGCRAACPWAPEVLILSVSSCSLSARGAGS